MNRFLIVEDSRDDAELLVQWLQKRFEAQVICVPSAEKAYEQAQCGKFQAVFVNLKLGPDKLAGIPVIRFFRMMETDLPIFVVTGYEDEHARTAAIAAGADGFFGKEYTPTDAYAVERCIQMRLSAIKKGRGMKSWRTTLWGAIAIAGGAVVAGDFGPLITKIAACVAMAANGIGLLVARDNKTSDEQAGAGRLPQQ